MIRSNRFTSCVPTAKRPTGSYSSEDPRRRNRPLPALVAFASIGFGFPATALAATPAGDHAGLGTLFWPGVNFLLTIFAIVWIYRRFGAPGLQDRRESFLSAFEKSQAAVRHAESLVAERMRRLEQIEAEKRRILSKLEAEGEAQARLILETGRQEAAAIQRDSHRQIESEKLRAHQEVRSAIIARAVELAEGNIPSRLSPEEDHRLRLDTLHSVLQ